MASHLNYCKNLHLSPFYLVSQHSSSSYPFKIKVKNLSYHTSIQNSLESLTSFGVKTIPWLMLALYGPTPLHMISLKSSSISLSFIHSAAVTLRTCLTAWRSLHWVFSLRQWLFPIHRNGYLLHLLQIFVQVFSPHRGLLPLSYLKLQPSPDAHSPVPFFPILLFAVSFLLGRQRLFVCLYSLMYSKVPGRILAYKYLLNV